MNKRVLTVVVLAGFVYSDIISSIVGRAVNAIINVAKLAQVNQLRVIKLALIFDNILL